MKSARLLEALTDRIERSTALDGLGAALNTALHKIIKPGPVEDTLSGVPVGHPVHPAIVAVPIGAWTSALVLDLAGQDEAARRLIGFGCLAALPAGATGASDWMYTNGAERRIGLVHALLNYGAIGVFGASWLARRSERRGAGIALSGVGATLLGVAGWLGGHLSYAQGVGVDTTAFQQFPADWTDVMPMDDVPVDGAVGYAQLGGVPVLVTTRGEAVVVMADRCTHRGAPLHEGEVRDGCVRCPWHDSAFSLDDGSVRSGPATRPQPMLETRVENGRVQARRDEERALRKNPVGH